MQLFFLPHPNPARNRGRERETEENRAINSRMGFLLQLLSSLSLLSLLILSHQVKAQPQPSGPVQAGFKCSSTKPTCNALVGYISPNKTTFSQIQTLFQVPTLLSLLSVNGLHPDTPPTQIVLPQQTVRIPFPCRCTDGYGFSDHVPIYQVVKDDGLFHIASQIFGGLMIYQQIQFVNHIKDANLIEVGQNLTIPLPCSCDDVNGREVVHYGYVVAAQGSVEGIAAEFGTTSQTLMTLNGITDPKKLMAGQVLDVPLTACSSSIDSSSLDFPLILPSGSSIYTANNCVKCNCDSTNNFTLQCQPSNLKPTKWSKCPTTQCSTNNLSLGNSTSTNCTHTTCAYAGYTKTNILTTAAVQNTCAAAPAKNESWKIQQSGWSWGVVLLIIQLLMVCYRFF